MYIAQKKNNQIKKKFRSSDQTFSQRRHIEGQHVHKKMLNITTYPGNANQNHNEISPHTC